MSPNNPWTWDPKTKRFRDPRGRFISHRTMIGIRDDVIEANRSWLADLVARLVGGDISIQQWERAFQERLRQVYIIEYQMGRGGSNAMTQTDWDAIEAALQRQYGYLRDFAREIASGQLSPEQIATRSQMYLSSATSAYEQGMAAARGLVLPAYPGDGSTKCLSNCRCHWRIVERKDRFDCYWTLGQAEHCPDCVERDSSWSPYVVPKI